MEQIIQHLVGNYGTLGLLVLIVGALGFFIIKELRKSNKDLIDKQVSLNQNMVSTIASSMSELSKTLTDDLRNQNKTLIEHLLNNTTIELQNHNKNLISRRNVTLEINNIINDLRVAMGANRVTIVEFHNSFANQTGFPFLKFTMTYEKFAKGCMPIQQQFQGTQFSAICDVCEDVLASSKHICELSSKDEVEEKIPMMLLHDKSNINSAIFKGIFNIENNLLIGLICIEFKSKLPEKYDELAVISAARTIGELITLSKATKDAE